VCGVQPIRRTRLASVSCSTSCSNPARKWLKSGRDPAGCQKFRTENTQNRRFWTKGLRVRDREAPGSNPGPPTSLLNTKVAADDPPTGVFWAHGAQTGTDSLESRLLLTGDLSRRHLSLAVCSRTSGPGGRGLRGCCSRGLRPDRWACRSSRVAVVLQLNAWFSERQAVAIEGSNAGHVRVAGQAPCQQSRGTRAKQLFG
jgi:hypothetical protein